MKTEFGIVTSVDYVVDDHDPSVPFIRMECLAQDTVSIYVFWLLTGTDVDRLFRFLGSYDLKKLIGKAVMYTTGDGLSRYVRMSGDYKTERELETE